MQGGEAVFIPGAHHTGSATQMVVERHLWDAQGNTKHDLDRQMTEAFVRPYDAGLVYRKEALVNWCCSLQSAILDIEVDHLHLTGPTELAVPGYSKPVSFGKMLFGARSRHRRRPRLCRAAVSTWCHSCTGGLGIAGWTTSQTGVSPGSSGGAAECQCTTLLQQMARRCGWRLLGGGCKAEGCGEGRHTLDLHVHPAGGRSGHLLLLWSLPLPRWAGQVRGGGEDHARFYATTLKTGHGILLWVAQVVMPGLDLTGRLSFETVLLHGLQGDWWRPQDVQVLGQCDRPPGCHQWGVPGGTVREGGGDPECRRGTRLCRMKSPTGIPECGADALRSTLCSTSFRKPSPQTMSGGGCVLR
ncbi:valine--tRNA ligase, mitochondrial-like [Scylla paramamosain]|uniref:valine--tRNA ligase, mitochondrial-like n=1 Tax=Scylla paramamosain TaxID=85552 RepID=UPI003083CB7B